MYVIRTYKHTYICQVMSDQWMYIHISSTYLDSSGSRYATTTCVCVCVCMHS